MSFETFGVKPMRCRGQLVIEVTSKENKSFLAHCLGWHRGNASIGSGETPEEAFADLCEQTGNASDPSKYLFANNSESKLPAVFVAADWTDR